LLFATDRRLQVNPIDCAALDRHTLFVELVGGGSRNWGRLICPNN
jgi:hypothetical protein